MAVYADIEKLEADIRNDVKDALDEAFPGTFDIVAPFRDLLPIGDGDVTAVPWVWRGTHTGPFQQARPTGNPVEITGVTLVRVEGGDLVYHRIVDWHTLYRQIGFLMVCRRPRSPDTEAADTIDIPDIAS